MSVYEGHGVTLHHGDCLDVLRSLPDASVDSVVTDPPYGLEFMGKDWDAPWKASAGSWADRDATDHAQPENRGQTSSPFLAAKVNKFAAGLPFQQWCEAWATECLRVLKPGGHLLAFGGTRTWHRLACAVEDAGFEVRDSIAWLYGSGFPKSLDVSKAIDKAAGAEREVVGPGRWNHVKGTGDQSAALIRPGNQHDITAPATDAAREWAGFGTALKPAFEPVVVARKPLVGTVAANVLAWGTGALNIAACRIGYAPDDPTLAWGEKFGGGKLNAQGEEYRTGDGTSGLSGIGQVTGTVNPSGRWPANVVLDESQAGALDEQSGTTQARIGKPRGADSGEGWGMTATGAEYDDLGGASRFFYVAKADASERPRLPKRSLRLRDDLTPEQVDHVRARLVEAGVQVD